MIIKWIPFATILAHIFLVNAMDFDDISDLDDEEPAKPCIGGICVLGSKEAENRHTPVEKSIDIKEDELQQPNVFDLVKLLALIAKVPDREQTKISFNVRDIQSGFQNNGKKYHVGNIHRKLSRDKRDTVSELNEGTEISLALTETSFDNSQSAVKEIGPKELVNKPVADSTANNENKSVDVNVRHAEADSFQDSNITAIYDPVANGTTTTSVNVGRNSNLTVVNESSNGQVDNTVNLESEKDLKVNNLSNGLIDNSESILFRTSKQSDSENATFGDENDPESLKNLTQPNKVKIPLSGKDLNKIQNVLSDDLGIESEGAKPVANFSLNGLESDKKNPVVVIVYNCSCGNKDMNHSHDNSTEHDVVGNDDKVILNTRRRLANDKLVISSLPTEENPEETLSEKAVQLHDKVQDNTNNALLENEMLQKCESLLSLQQKSKVNEASKPKSGNYDEKNISLSQVNTELSNQQPSSGVNDDDGVSAKKTLIDNVNINDANVSKAALNSDVVDEAVSLANESVNAIADQASNLPTTDKVVDEAGIGTRKKRSVTNDKHTLTKRDTTPQEKHGLKDIVESIFKYTMIPNKFAEDSEKESILPNNESAAVETRNVKDKEINVKSDLLNSQNNKQSVENVLEFIHKNFPNDFLDHAEHSKDVAIKTKKEVKSTRNPKYYDYLNDKPNLLDSDPNPGKYDGIIVSFRPINNDKEVINTNNIESAENGMNNYNSIDIINEDKLPSHNGDISNDDKDLLNLLSFKPVYVNVNLQILMKNFRKDQQ